MTDSDTEVSTFLENIRTSKKILSDEQVVEYIAIKVYGHTMEGRPVSKQYSYGGIGDVLHTKIDCAIRTIVEEFFNKDEIYKRLPFQSQLKIRNNTIKKMGAFISQQY